MDKMSPFYPHGGIPVPFSGGLTASCVEGIWQGLKVFENEGIHRTCFQNDTMKNLKRTVRVQGRCIGHQKGVNSSELLGYIDARKQILVPSYVWMLEHRCQKQIEMIKELQKTRTVVLLDYDTNDDIEDPAKPLSHTSLIKRYVEETLPI